MTATRTGGAAGARFRHLREFVVRIERGRDATAMRWQLGFAVIDTQMSPSRMTFSWTAGHCTSTSQPRDGLLSSTHTVPLKSAESAGRRTTMRVV